MMARSNLNDPHYAAGLFDGLVVGTPWPPEARKILKELLRIWLRPEMVKKLVAQGTLP